MATKKKPAAPARIKVVITTKHRGVFYGEIDPGDVFADKIEIHNKRNCLRWGGGLKGFVDLSVAGPNNQCRIGPAAPTAWTRDITDVLLCTPEAAAKWESAPWAN